MAAPIVCVSRCQTFKITLNRKPYCLLLQLVVSDAVRSFVATVLHNREGNGVGSSALVRSIHTRNSGNTSAEYADVVITDNGAVGALITIALADLIVPLLPYMLSFAAGAMLYVVVEELIPEMSEGEHSNIGVIFFAVGFSLMMMLDVALG